MGLLDPAETPQNTTSCTLEDVYNRLDAGIEGTEGAFAEPIAGPATETMHTIDEILGIAPQADNTDGATPAEVLAARTYWSLRTDGAGSSSWGEEAGSLYGGCTCSGILVLGRWCDNEDGTVTDMTNCLVWLKKADWGGAKPWRQPGDADQNDDAHTRAGLLAAGSAGADLNDGSAVGDWRLPTREELLTLANGTWPQSVYDPIRVTGLPDSGEIWFWTSTTKASNTSNAYFVKLTDDDNTNGDDGTISKEYDSQPGINVWPVRGGQQ